MLNHQNVLVQIWWHCVQKHVAGRRLKILNNQIKTFDWWHYVSETSGHKFWIIKSNDLNDKWWQYVLETLQDRGTGHKCGRVRLICCSRYETKAVPVIWTAGSSVWQREKENVILSLCLQVWNKGSTSYENYQVIFPAERGKVVKEKSFAVLWSIISTAGALVVVTV